MTFIMGRDTFMTVLQEDGRAIAVLNPGDDLLESMEKIKDAAKELGIKSITIEAATKAQLRVVVEEEPKAKARKEETDGGSKTGARKSGGTKQSGKSSKSSND